MTIIFAIRRPTFVIMGADRLFYEYASHGATVLPMPSGTHSKLALHPSLPIACATAGIAFFHGQSSTSLIQGVLDQVTGLDGEAPETIVGVFEKRFIPLVSVYRRNVPPAMDPELGKLDILIGFVARDQAHLCRLRIGLESTKVWDNSFFSSPRELGPFYTETVPYRDDPWFYADHLDEPSDLAAHMSKIIEDGARYESTLWEDKQNHLCGGGVDVAVVGPSIARWHTL